MWRSCQMSDSPLWIEVETDFSDDYISQPGVAPGCVDAAERRQERSAVQGSVRKRIEAMFYIMEPDERPDGYVVLSETPEWMPWLNRNIPAEIDKTVRIRLKSNLKHLIVGLELKAALIEPHQQRKAPQRPVLFESYFQNLIHEFCVGAFSVLEGLGAAHWLQQQGRTGEDGPRIVRDQWLPALCAVYDPQGDHALTDAVNATVVVRDKLHQDRLGMREDIDWHALSYENAFVPASQAIGTLLRREADSVPKTTNLARGPA